MSPLENSLTKDLLNLAKLALNGKHQDIHLLLYKIGKKIKKESPELAIELNNLLAQHPANTLPVRKINNAQIPVDIDSRLSLIRVENILIEPRLIFSDQISNLLNQTIKERENQNQLLMHGLFPTKTLLFTGPPGVGKTMAAKWIAFKLQKPLLILDLSAVMSSYLGRTGTNIRYVLDYAKNTDCVLLLDEIDSIAKRRDDSSEIGELKRLVTVLLQEIDEWPSSGMLIAATNHPNLLDPAVWRRFDQIIDFKLPDSNQIEKLLTEYFEENEVNSVLIKTLSIAFKGESFSEIERVFLNFKKRLAIDGIPIQDQVYEFISNNQTLSKEDKISIAKELIAQKVSQREISRIVGISRDTIRKYLSLDQ